MLIVSRSNPTVVMAHRHKFLEDVDVLRAEERARNQARRLEVLERRQQQIAEVIEKKKGGGS